MKCVCHEPFILRCPKWKTFVGIAAGYVWNWRSCTLFSIHPYYTPKFTEFQVILAKTYFFVDNDGELCKHSYVNHLF